MGASTTDRTMELGDGSSLFLKILHAAMALPGARVNRASFLRAQLRPHFPDEQVEGAIKYNPAHAGMPQEKIDEIANSVIKPHVLLAAGVSFGAGLPGGLAMAATIPADTVQFAWHSIVVAQKLAYLYGWPDLLEESKLDEETDFRMTLLIGVMMGVSEANKLLAEIARRFAHEVGQRLPRYALTRTVYYPLIKTVLRWVGVSLTKQSFARSISKIIPIVSGLVSAGVTAYTLRPMARRLKNHLRTLEYAGATAQTGDAGDTNSDLSGKVQAQKAC